MGLRDRFRFALAAAEVSAGTSANLNDGPSVAFSVIDQASIDPAFFGLPAYPPSSTAPAARVNRREAIQVSAVKRSRDLVAGTIGSLPIYVLNRDNERGTRGLLEQPELGVPRSVTFARTVEDMLFEGVAWWRITAYGWDNKPARVVRLDPTTVQIRERQRVFVRSDGSQQGSSWEYVPDDQLICFPSPNDPLLVAGARAIRTCLQLDGAAFRYAEEPQPLGWFSPEDGTDVSNDEALEALNGWKQARQQRATGFLRGLKYNQANAWSPEQLQLVEARQHAVTEIARLTGLDPEELGVPMTTRTYFNATDRRMTFQDMTLGPYVTAIQDRLSMDDVTPAGYRVRFDFSSFTRSDEQSRMETYEKAIAIGAYGLEEVIRREELPEPPKKPEPAPEPDQDDEQRPETDRVQQESDMPSLTLAASTRLTLDFDSDATFDVSEDSRTITGLAVPYGVVTRKNGLKFKFSQGSLKWADKSRVKLLRDHDNAQPIGRAVRLEDTDRGLFATFKVARGPEGDRALALAADGVLDGLSVGVDFLDGGLVEDPTDKGVSLVKRAALREISLTAMPAYDDARLTSVAASTTERDLTMTDATEPQAPAAPAAAAVDFSALTSAVTGAIQEGFAALPPRQVVPAAAGVLSVREELPYRFDGGRTQYDFSSDVISHLRDRDGVAGQRVLGFMHEAFANIATTAVDELNPNRQRPDLYVDQSQ